MPFTCLPTNVSADHFILLSLFCGVKNSDDINRRTYSNYISGYTNVTVLDIDWK